MERLEKKKINGKYYYYYSEWAWKDGKCRRAWQKYLGKLQDIVKACEGGDASLYADLFQWGLPVALYNEASIAKITEIVDGLCPKRKQGMTTGEYITIAAINRAIRPASKNSIWNWFSQTALMRYFLSASKEALSSQRFWDHMERIDAKMIEPIWKSIIKSVVENQNIDLSKISYDGTNFYSFIDTFNIKCDIANRGVNKQKRNNLRQISYALFCCADGHTPLYYDVYEGNMNDARQFPLMLEKFDNFLKEIQKEKFITDNITLIFDKGNNSESNFKIIDQMKLNFVGSVKISEHKELAEISNCDDQFISFDSNDLEGTKAFRVRKTVYGKERILVICYNQNLFDTQYLTIQNDISKALNSLSILQQKLCDRASGLIKKGRAFTTASLEKQCLKILSRQYMKQLIPFKIKSEDTGRLKLEYAFDAGALHKLSDTHLGKNILITNQEEWDNSRIIKTYRSQYTIENVFREMKDRTIGSWWPMNHWTDQKIRVHGLYCSIALLIRAMMWRRVQSGKINISMKRLLSELDNIHQIVNIYPKKGRQKKERKQVVFSRTTELQDNLISVLKLNENKKNF